MSNMDFDKSRVAKFLIWTFSLAYIIQVGVWRLYQSGNVAIGQLVLAAMMFVPMLGVLLSGGKLSGMGWKPQIKKNIKTILIAWFAPIILTAIGAAIYFIIFPGHFDLSGSALVANADSEALRQLEAQGLTYPMYILSSIIGCITYAPLLNGIFAMGEEAGWRGFLYPQLKAKLGRRNGRILGGSIWGAWHWPIIWLIGYEYGTEYFGFPVVGMLLFCVVAIAIGVFCDWVYERSESIWLPSILHGAINAAATIPVAVCMPDTGSARLLGPAPNGIIAGLPFLVVAVVMLLHGKKERHSF